MKFATLMLLGVVTLPLGLLAQVDPLDRQDVMLSTASPKFCVGLRGQCFQGRNCCPGLVCTFEGNRAFCEKGSPILPPSINILPAPSAGAVTLPYSFTFTAANGVLPLTWNETGALPPGLVFSNNGLMSGVPSKTGAFPITVNVEDSLGNSATPRQFTIQVFLHGFKTTGDMITERTSHAATVLRSGKVLITGGFSDVGGLATAELFSPATGTFAPTGNMETGRFDQTSTLLTSGKVLMAGGGTAAAELYNPGTGKFSPTGSMDASRVYQTATLLTNGRVLVTGGGDVNFNPIASAEIYDPINGTFTATGNMISARYGHTATLLPNGKVLVTGGLGRSGQSLATAELFDPATGIFTATGTMTSARYAQTATLLPNGIVLVTGGFNVSNKVIGTAETFDPNTGKFTAAGNMTVVRAFHTATVMGNGQVLVVGGLGAGSTPGDQAAAELFNPSTRTFQATGSLTNARSSHTMTLLLNGKVLVTGGAGNATAETYQ